MNEIVSDRLRDCSDAGSFVFSLECPICARLWQSRRTRFSRAGVTPESEGKRVIYETLYARERELARHQAAQQATEIFSLCPICGRLACDSCFLICEDLDMCAECSDRLKERGEPVSSHSPPGPSHADSFGSIPP